jgi:hypothetical protein
MIIQQGWVDCINFLLDIRPALAAVPSFTDLMQIEWICKCHEYHLGAHAGQGCFRIPIPDSDFLPIADR